MSDKTELKIEERYKVLNDNIISILTDKSNKEEYIDLAHIGGKLMEFPINHKNQGTEVNLKKFISSQPELYNIKNKNTTVKVALNIKSKGNKSVGTALTSNCHFQAYHQSLESLNSLILTEKKESLSILDSYINAIYYKCLKDSLIRTSNNKFACFNTGLFSNSLRYIYGLMLKPNDSCNKYNFVSFCVPGIGKHGKELIRNFGVLPDKPKFYKCVSELFFEPNAKIHPDFNHIIIDNVKRLPVDLIKECINGFDSIKNINSLDV